MINSDRWNETNFSAVLAEGILRGIVQYLTVENRTSVI